MPPPRPVTFERPDLENRQSYIRRFLPAIRRQGTLPSSNFRNRIKTVEHFWRLIYRTHFEDNNNEDDQWEPYALLGKGGFGSVDAWKKRNPENREIVDELAVKTMHFQSQRAITLSVWGNGQGPEDLLEEAVIQRQLNDAESENIVHLRGYKYFKSRNDANANNGRGFQVPMGKEFKLYLEYAPYDTLESLRRKYRYYHQYLPEAFLWHVFDSLASAALTVRQCPQHNLPYPNAENAPKGNASLVHFDLKLENIFLGYPEPYGLRGNRGGTRFYDYPTIKLGDFGLMTFVNQDNDGSVAALKNPRYWLRAGK